MQKDQLFTRRRMLLAGGAALGAAGTAGAVLAAGGADTARTAAAPAAGPRARRALAPNAFRLQPLTGDGPPRAAPRKLKVRQEPILRISGRGRRMVLTFDDGPHPDYTPDILDTLAEYDVRAMFFVCGECVVDNKELLARMADEGHVVGNHTWTHPLLTSLDRDEIRDEMESTSDVIEDAYGERPQWFRAPYGAWNRAAFQLGADMGMEPMAWTVDTTDWMEPGTSAIVDRVEEGAAPGVVVLSHDAGGDRSQTVRAIREWLPYLLDSGYHLTVPRRRV
ncbi:MULTISPECIES: polysaccharide deacetylase family protein [Streptomyces]|uniref:Polysaccharide deacetylase family protein n=3 Tax=Streptomyces TaxID=1883 RepID=A0ABS9JIY8_9ACTN|nr:MULTISPECIES: polysaccharide deacetylase family protein [Streptomyces]MYU26639.1 polysaccharide deacetylase family protein [Streptomyces sp. SID7810]CUW25457.1 Peptidoglycan-N-acetylglucosamine deacetylase [Streptomyces reticuli]MCG0065522.1 polysaccharide deacetylase family protein [Streptomyces tricolor]OYP13809.1 polysaccharide deacetylase family protein [Streptomyces sp. FBKL.4005]BCM65621.1 putative oligosaccharide deacetylase, secreted [Streptomyces sp. EAS-AB2608]